LQVGLLGHSVEVAALREAAVVALMEGKLLQAAGLSVSEIPETIILELPAVQAVVLMVALAQVGCGAVAAAAAVAP
jgi:hypothetical protein